MDRIELEESTGARPVADERRRMDEPPPVRVVAVADVTLTCPESAAGDMDGFYVGRLNFFRQRGGGMVYKSETVRLIFDVTAATVDRVNLRPLGVEVPSLNPVERGLIDDEIEYIRQRDITTGQLTLLVQDPAGNWIELFEFRAVG